MRWIGPILLAACAAPRQGPAEVSLERVKYGTPEVRYHAVLALARREGPDSLAALREQLKSREPLTRNAAARALCARGEVQAAAELVNNLHRTRRTYVCTDAIYHLRALYGTDLGYNPNLGYRHQTEAQLAWWLKVRGEAPPPEPPDPEGARERGRLRDEIEAWTRLDVDVAEGRMQELWAALAQRAKTRDLDDVALREEAFARFAKWRGDDPDLWNNHALAALNNGHYATAERSYRTAIGLQPDAARLHNDLGILLEGLERLEEAERSYREAYRLAPTDDVVVCNLADVVAARGRAEEARELYRAAERLAPSKWYYHRLWAGRLTAASSRN